MIYREGGRDNRERERGERDREVKGIEPNALPQIMGVVLRPIPTKREGDAHGSLFERKILPNRAINRKERLNTKIITRNH